MNYQLDTNTLTLDRIDRIPDGYKTAEPGKKNDYIEEMIDTIFMRSLQTIMADCFKKRGHYLFGNRTEYWGTPDFVIFAEPEDIFMIETKKEKPTRKEIQTFLNYCARLEKLLSTEKWYYEKGKPHSYNSMLNHGRERLPIYETIYFCAFFKKTRAQYGLKKSFGIPPGDRLRKDKFLPEWKDYLLRKTAHKLMTDPSNLQKRANSTMQNSSITSIESLPTSPRALQPHAVWLVPAFRNEVYQECLSSTPHKTKTAENAYILRYQLHIRKIHEFVVSFDDPIKWQSYRT